MAFGIDTKNASALATSTTTVAVTLTVSAGDLVCVSLWSVDDATLVSIKDQANNSYTIPANSPASFNASVGKFWLAYRLNAPSGSTTITGTFSPAAAESQIQAVCFTVSGGSATFDKDVAKATGSSTTINLPSLTPTNSNSLLYAFGNTAGSISSANSPWTLGTIAATTGNADEYDLDVTGAQAVNFTSSLSAWQAMSMAFYIAAAAALDHGEYLPPIGGGWDSTVTVW